MALVTFQCKSCAPFMMFSDSASEIFKILDIQLTSSGVLRNDKLPEILEKIEAAYRESKARVEEITTSMERDISSSRMQKAEELSCDLEVFQSRVHLFQRLFPLQEMMRRAIKHGDHILWEMN